MSKRPTIRKTPRTKGISHQTPPSSSGHPNGHPYGNPDRAQMRTELVLREKPATTIKATMAKMPPSTQYKFGILVIEQRSPLSLSLQRDIHFLKFSHTSLHRTQSLNEARTLLTKQSMELVIVSLNFPQDALADFFRDYPAYRRPFALILTETPEQSITEAQSATAYLHYLRSTNLVAEQQASGYLLLGTSSNQHLTQSLERARRWVQERFVREYQERIVASLGDYFEHPAIAARQRLARIHEQVEHSGLYAVADGLILHKKTRSRQTVPFDKIVYLQGAGKYVYVWYFTDNNVLQALYLLKQDVLPYLPPFILNVHMSYWVNVVYIRELNDAEIVLLTNDPIPIARRERKAIENALDQMRPDSLVIPILKNVLTRSTTQRTSLEDTSE